MLQKWSQIILDGFSTLFSGDAKCVLEKTLIQNFGTGINCAADTTLTMNQATILNCGTGMATGDKATIHIVSSQFNNNSDFAVFHKTKSENVLANGEKKKIISNFGDLLTLMP